MPSYEELEPRIPKIVKNGISSNEDIDLIESFGKYLSNHISNSQIRRAYSEVMRLKMDYNHQDLLLIRPKLAYAVGRERDRSKKNAYKKLAKAMSKAIETVDDQEKHEEQEKRFQNLASFFEAILAYHKAHGGE